MLFNSLAFFIFLGIVFPLYWKVFRNSLRWQNFFVLVASYVFYGWWDWRFLILIVASSAVDYFVGQKIFKHRGQRAARWWVALSLIINLGALGFFKYHGFFIDSFIAAFEGFGITLHRPSLNIILPVGISFYTFQTLSYSLDVYRGKLEPTRDVVAFFAFVAFFPQLVAGPIERATHLLPQFLQNRKFDLAFAVSGLRIMLWGFFKKVVISDNLGPVADVVFNSPDQFEGIQIWLAVLLFTIQIYCDFSGYSDLAIGCGRLFGFDIMTNFRTPFFSKSMAEFWNRWHISLNTWFRDYVYFPLGGNRVSQPRWVWNILVVFGLSGLWHGSNWTFLFWGWFNGLILIYARYTARLKDNLYHVIGFKIGTVQRNLLDGLLVFSLVVISFVFFRSKNATDMMIMFGQGMMGWAGQVNGFQEVFWSMAMLFTSMQQMTIIGLSVLILLLIDAGIGKDDFHLFIHKKSAIKRWSLYFFIAGWTVLFGAFSRPETFIYFQF